MPKARWAIQSTVTLDDHLLTHWFEKQALGFFNHFTADAEKAMTWPRKADATGYMRRVLGTARDYEIVNLGPHILGVLCGFRSHEVRGPSRPAGWPGAGLASRP